MRFKPLDPFETPMAIEAICESFNREIDSCEIDPLILIPAFIIDFLCIHPFNDGTASGGAAKKQQSAHFDIIPIE